MNRRTYRVRWSRPLVGAALGLSLAWSCGGGAGGGSCGGCGTDCDNCLPGENLYECAAPSGSNTAICAIDDITADQHCAAIGSVVAGKVVCPGNPPAGGSGVGDDAPGDDSPGADETASDPPRTDVPHADR